jgi:hypothetical protein
VTGPAVLMDRDGAVGWRDIPLDGMTCYHRCIEAALRGQGFSAVQVAEEMGGAVTDRLGQDGAPHFRLRASTACWRVAAPGTHHWEALRTALAAGRAVVIWPDGYFWPGDVCEGRRHIHHHAVLATEIKDDVLWVLDIDAPEDDGYTRAIPVTAATKQACTRILELTAIAHGRPFDAAGTDRMVAASVRPLARFATAAGALGNRWADGADRRLAHAADLWVLGDIQPQLFLLATIGERFGRAALAAAGFAAAAQAKKISLFLFGLAPYGPRAPYDLCQDDMLALVDRMWAVAREAASVSEVPQPEPDSTAGPWLWQRLNSLSVWHFGVDLNGSPRNVHHHRDEDWAASAAGAVRRER